MFGGSGGGGGFSGILMARRMHAAVCLVGRLVGRHSFVRG